MSGLRVVFFGMENPLSQAPLAALLQSSCEVRAVVVPRPRGMTAGTASLQKLPPPARRPGLPLLAPPGEPTIVGLAWEAGIPVYEVGGLAHDRTRAVLAGLRPDLICIACFPRLLPRAILRIPHYGVLNLHPSLLPAYRGPSPLFWVFHGQTHHHLSASPAHAVEPGNVSAAWEVPPWLPNEGLGNAGVTVHVVDEQADSGDIVAQTPLILPDGIGYHAAERTCAEEGGRLLVAALDALGGGRVVRRPQPFRDVPIAPVPVDADFVITPDWTARRAFNFVRGVVEWGRPITMAVDRRRFIVREALSFDEAAVMRKAVDEGSFGHIRVRCSAGVLTVMRGNGGRSPRRRDSWVDDR